MAFIQFLTSGQIGGWLFPKFFYSLTQTDSFLTIDADGEKVGFSGYAPITGTIDAVVFSTRAVASAPGNGLKVSLQDLALVGAVQGAPDGTIDQYRVVTGITAASNIETGLITDDGTDTGTKRTVTKGDPIGVVIEYESFEAGNDVDIYIPRADQQRSMASLFTSSWARQAGFGAGCLLKYDDGSYYPLDELYGVCPISKTTPTFHVNTTPDEKGVKFQVPVDCVISGVIHSNGPQNATEIVLYNSSSTELEAITVTTGDVLETSNSNVLSARYFANRHELTADTDYRLTLRPTGTGTNALVELTYDSSAYRAGDIGVSNYVLTERTDGGSWTDTDTIAPVFTLILSEVDTGSSGGGGQTIMPVPYYRF